MKPSPCPANNCDAELYSVGELVFCPKCKAPNPNYTRITERKASQPTRKEPEIDVKAGVIHWN